MPKDRRVTLESLRVSRDSLGFGCKQFLALKKKVLNCRRDLFRKHREMEPQSPSHNYRSSNGLCGYLLHPVKLVRLSVQEGGPLRIWLLWIVLFCHLGYSQIQTPLNNLCGGIWPSKLHNWRFWIAESLRNRTCIQTGLPASIPYHIGWFWSGIICTIHSWPLPPRNSIGDGRTKNPYP